MALIPHFCTHRHIAVDGPSAEWRSDAAVLSLHCDGPVRDWEQVKVLPHADSNTELLWRYGMPYPSSGDLVWGLRSAPGTARLSTTWGGGPPWTPPPKRSGIGAPRPHAVNGVFPRALCFWVVVTLGTILGFVHCDALFVLTRQVPYVFGAGTRRLYVMLSGLAAAACSQCAPASRKRHVGCSCTYQAVS